MSRKPSPYTPYERFQLLRYSAVSFNCGILTGGAVAFGVLSLLEGRFVTTFLCVIAALLFASLCEMADRHYLGDD